MKEINIGKMNKFQSTLPRRERLSGVGKTTINDIISIHTPTKGATDQNGEVIAYYIAFQSTLPQRERLAKEIDEIRALVISIHTPTKGATISVCAFSKTFTHFNPHSHKGSDLGGIGAIGNVLNFNPHSHKGSDSNINQ